MTIGEAMLAGEQVDKRVEENETSVDAFNGGEQVGEVFG